MWGNSGTNECGEYLFDFIISSNLVKANQGDEPTFLTSNRKEALGITLVNSDFSDNFRDRFVFSECFISDHRYITFSIDINESRPSTTIPANTKYRRNTNWTILREKLRSSLASTPKYYYSF